MWRHTARGPACRPAATSLPCVPHFPVLPCAPRSPLTSLLPIIPSPSLQGLRVVQQRPLDFVVAAVISFLVNLFCYLSIRHVSATSFKVAGKAGGRAGRQAALPAERQLLPGSSLCCLQPPRCC
jgi:hypothetical protein